MSISVVIPIYNTQKYVREAIVSCLIQKVVSQIILVDDGSEDGSLTICEELAEKHERVTLVRHDQNKGRSAARNTGLSFVKKDFFSFLDADDYFLAGRFLNALSVLERNPDVDGVYESVLSNFQEERGENYYPQKTELEQLVEPHKLFQNLVLGKGHFSIIGCLFRSSSMLNTALFDIDLKVGEDTDFLWRVSSSHRLCGIQSEPKVIRRVHGENVKFDHNASIQGKVEFYKKWKAEMNKYEMTYDMKNKIVSSYAYYKSLKGGSKSRIFQKLYQAVELLKNPNSWKSLFR